MQQSPFMCRVMCLILMSLIARRRSVDNWGHSRYSVINTAGAIAFAKWHPFSSPLSDGLCRLGAIGRDMASAVEPIRADLAEGGFLSKWTESLQARHSFP